MTHTRDYKMNGSIREMSKAQIHVFYFIEYDSTTDPVLHLPFASPLDHMNCVP